MSRDGCISDCKFAMYVHCVDEIKKTDSDLGSRHSCKRNRSDVTSLDILKSCCHHSLRGMCVQAEGAW